MKTIGVILVTLALAAVMAGYVIRSKELRATNARLAAVQQEAQEKSRLAEEAVAQRAKAEEQHTNLIKLTSEMGAALEAQRKTATNQPPASNPAPAAEEKGGLGKMIGQMMKDPQMRGFIQKQQRMMMDQLYAPLIKELGMTPEEGEKFKDLLASNAIRATERATSVLGGQASENQRETLKSLTEEQKLFEEDLRAYLGDKRYAKYKDYNETINERTQLNMFRQQFAGDQPITEQQSEQLLGLMREEKQAIAPELAEMSKAGQDPEKLKALLSDGQTERLMQSQETLNARVYSRASGVLNPEQLSAFGRFQTNQLDQMRLGLTMARKMFGGAESGK